MVEAGIIKNPYGMEFIRSLGIDIVSMLGVENPEESVSMVPLVNPAVIQEIYEIFETLSGRSLCSFLLDREAGVVRPFRNSSSETVIISFNGINFAVGWNEQANSSY